MLTAGFGMTYTTKSMVSYTERIVWQDINTKG